MRTPFFSLNLQLFQNVFRLLFISFFTYLWNSLNFNLQISVSHFALLNYHIHLTLSSIFHNFFTRPKGEENKQSNVMCYCVMRWYSYARLNMMQKHLQTNKDTKSSIFLFKVLCLFPNTIIINLTPQTTNKKNYTKKWREKKI